MSAESIILKAKKDCGKAGERSEKVQIDKQHPLSRISDASGIQSFFCVCAVAHSARGHHSVYWNLVSEFDRAGNRGECKSDTAIYTGSRSRRTVSRVVVSESVWQRNRECGVGVCAHEADGYAK